LGFTSVPVLIDPPPFLLSSKNVKQAEESKNLFSLLSIWVSYHMTWGVTFIGQRGQFEIGLKGSLCVGISNITDGDFDF
jgi:hypothetical protein